MGKQKDEWTGGDELPRRDPEELKQIARDIYSGAIYIADPKEPPNIITARFMPLGLGALVGAPPSYVNSIGLIFEHMGKAGPSGLNGGPMFFSCQFLHKEDVKIVQGHITKIEEAIDGPLPE